MKARSTPALLPFKGQVTEQTTVKWSGQLDYKLEISIKQLDYELKISIAYLEIESK